VITLRVTAVPEEVLADEVGDDVAGGEEEPVGVGVPTDPEGDGLADDAVVLRSPSVKGSPTSPAAPNPTPTAATAKTAHRATSTTRRSTRTV